MTSTYDGFEISGGTSSTSLLGVSGGEVRIVGSGTNVVIDFPTVSTTLVGVHNTVSGISGATGNIGLLAGSNVTISQSGRTFTISSSGGGGGGGTTLFAGIGITLTTAASGTTVSTILGMTSASDGFLISGGITQRTFGVCGGDVTIEGGTFNTVITFPNVSTTLVGIHNAVTSFNGSTGDITFAGGVTGVNGQTGNAFAYGYYLGFTSTANLSTFPDGGTANYENNSAIFYTSAPYVNTSTGEAKVNRIYYVPIVIPTQTTIQTLKISSFNTGITGNVTFGIYNINVVGMPNTRLYQSSSIIVESGFGTTQVTSGSGLITLTPGYYYLATVFNNTPKVYSIGIQSGTYPSPFGSKNLNGGYQNRNVISDNGSYSLPSTASSLRFVDYVGITYIAAPIVEFRVL
jgi:hypothetical protein